MKISKRDREILEQCQQNYCDTLVNHNFPNPFPEDGDILLLKKSYNEDPYSTSENDIRMNVEHFAKSQGIKVSMGKRSSSGAFCDVYDILWDGEEAILKVAWDKERKYGAIFTENQNREISYLKHFTKESEDSYTAKLLHAWALRDELGYPKTFYIVLKKYQPFSNYIDKYPITERRLCSIAKDVLNDLAYLHGNGVIHRDIKPDNIVVNYIEDKPRFLLIDFNVSRSVGVGDSSIMMTKVGTSCYQDPVLASDGRGSYYTDIYSLGSVLYELIVDSSGLYSNADPEEKVKTFPRVRWDIAQKQGMPKTKYKQTIRNLLLSCAKRSGISEELCDVVLRAVEPDKSERYKDTKEMLKAIDRLMGEDIKDNLEKPDAKYFVSFDEDGDLIWATRNPPEDVLKVDPLNYNQSLACIFDKFSDLQQACRNKNYIEKPSSFFENLIYERNIAGLEKIDFFKNRIEENKNSGKKGALLQLDRITLKDSTKLMVVSSVIFQGEEYAYCCSMQDEDYRTYIDDFCIRKLTSNGSLIKETNRHILCQVITLLWGKMRDEKVPSRIFDLVITCYYNGCEEDLTSENYTRLLSDALESDDPKVRSVAACYLGGSYLTGSTFGFGKTKVDRKKAQELLSQSTEDYAVAWRESAYGFTTAHCVLWAALVLGEILYGYLLYQNGCWAWAAYVGIKSPFSHRLLCVTYYVYAFIVMWLGMWKFGIAGRIIGWLPMLLVLVMSTVGVASFSIKWAIIDCIFVIAVIILPKIVTRYKKKKRMF